MSKRMFRCKRQCLQLKDNKLQPALIGPAVLILTCTD